MPIHAANEMKNSAIGSPIFDYSLISSHPRLLLTTSAEEELRLNLETNQYLKSAHDKIIGVAVEILSKPNVEYKLVGIRLLEVSREALKRIFYLSYAYRMEKDSRYLQRAEQELLAVCNFPDWNPSHFLDVGEMAMAVAIG